MDGKADVVLNSAIDSLNELLPDDKPLSKERGTILLGNEGELDSLGFVNLVAAVEEQLEKQLGIKSVLVDELMRVEGVLTIGGLSEILVHIVRNASQRTQ